MNLNTLWMFWKFLIIGAAVQLVIRSAAAESPSALICDVARQPDGSFRYWLSRQPSPSSCRDRETCWEDQDKNVLALDSVYNLTLVQNLTDRCIVLKDCRDYLHYTKNCIGGDFEEAHCRVNCTDLVDNLHPPTVNTTLTCLGSWCLSQHTVVGLGIAAISLLAVGVACCYLWKFISKRRRRRESSYSVNEKIKMEII